MTSRFYTIALLSLMTLSLTFSACTTDEDCFDNAGSPCDPMFDLEDCVCSPIGQEGTTETSDEALEAEDAQKYRYILIEDLTDPVGGDAPGADIDAVSVTTANNVEHFAKTIEDFNIGLVGNDYADITQLLGGANSGSEKQNFASLGGVRADGYVILGFSTGSSTVEFGSGARVTVYELGSTNCPNKPRWDDDPYSVAVSVSNGRSSFTEIGTGGPGTNVVTIP